MSTAMQAAYARFPSTGSRATRRVVRAAFAEAIAPYLAAGCRCFNFVPEQQSSGGEGGRI